MVKSPFKMDERSTNIALRVMSVMYIITLVLINGSLFYRQFVLHQESEQFDDIAMILVFNAVFLLSGILYFGGIPINKIKPKFVLLGYFIFVIGGILFTYIKYTFLSDYQLTFSQILDKFYIVAIICGLFVGFYLLFAFIGKRKIEKDLN